MTVATPTISHSAILADPASKQNRYWLLLRMFPLIWGDHAVPITVEALSQAIPKRGRDYFPLEYLAVFVVPRPRWGYYKRTINKHHANYLSIHKRISSELYALIDSKWRDFQNGIMTSAQFYMWRNAEYERHDAHKTSKYDDYRMQVVQAMVDSVTPVETPTDYLGRHAIYRLHRSFERVRRMQR